MLCREVPEERHVRDASSSHDLLYGDGLIAFFDNERQTYVLQMLGSGHFVTVLPCITVAGTDIVGIDVFRLTDGLIVERADVMEEISLVTPWVNVGEF